MEPASRSNSSQNLKAASIESTPKQETGSKSEAVNQISHQPFHDIDETYSSPHSPHTGRSSSESSFDPELFNKRLPPLPANPRTQEPIANEPIIRKRVDLSAVSGEKEPKKALSAERKAKLEADRRADLFTAKKTCDFPAFNKRNALIVELSSSNEPISEKKLTKFIEKAKYEKIKSSEEYISITTKAMKKNNMPSGMISGTEKDIRADIPHFEEVMLNKQEILKEVDKMKQSKEKKPVNEDSYAKFLENKQSETRNLLAEAGVKAKQRADALEAKKQAAVKGIKEIKSGDPEAEKAAINYRTTISQVNQMMLGNDSGFAALSDQLEGRLAYISKQLHMNEILRNSG